MTITKQLITKLARQTAAATDTSNAITELEALKSKDLRIIKLIEDAKQKLKGQIALTQATKDQLEAVQAATKTDTKKT